MTEVEENECEELECVEYNEVDNCMEFQIGLMIEPHTQQISIETPNGNKAKSNYSVLSTQNASRKRKLDSDIIESSKTSSFKLTNVRSLNESNDISKNEALDTATILSALDNLRTLMTQIAAKTDSLYEDFQKIKNERNAWQENSLLDRTFIGIPLATKEELTQFEERLQNDGAVRSLLKKSLHKVDDRSWEKYVYNCLTSCFKSELALQCSFYGKKNNIEMQHLNIINILKECVGEKYSMVRVCDVNKIITRWFHLATDRYKRLLKNKLIDE